ncbi:MAG: hypothetical protein ACK56U_16420, partial [Planctomyces sp.]
LNNNNSNNNNKSDQIDPPVRLTARQQQAEVGHSQHPRTHTRGLTPADSHPQTHTRRLTPADSHPRTPVRGSPTDN